MNSFFGTDGMRGAIGTGLFTQERLPQVAYAIALWLNARYKKGAAKPRIVIIHDTRNACAYIKSLFKMIFLAQTIDVYDAGVVPTPAAQCLIEKCKADCALIISASHNPWSDNGIKIMDRCGKLDNYAESVISELIGQEMALTINYDHMGNETYIHGAQEYIHTITQLFKENFLRGKKVVLDCAHGATSALAPQIFKFFGAQVIPLNTTPTGFNINHECGPLAPKGLQRAVIDHAADIGFAFDGDGDRVIAVNRYGSIKNGDDILALLSTHSDYNQQKTIVATIMSNVGLEYWLAAQGKLLLRTGVGDKFVAQKLEESHSVLGGEQSGHIILKNYSHTGDGILVALKILETLIERDNKQFETFIPYPQILITIPIQKICDLTEKTYADLITAAEKKVPYGRVSVRYSGTEKNMLRIMVESELLHDAHTTAHHLATQLQKELS